MQNFIYLWSNANRLLPATFTIDLMTKRVKTQGMIIYPKKNWYYLEKILANSVCHTMPQLDSLFSHFWKSVKFATSACDLPDEIKLWLAVAVLLFFRDLSNDMLLATGGCVRKKFGVHPKPLAGTWFFKKFVLRKACTNL